MLKDVKYFMYKCACMQSSKPLVHCTEKYRNTIVAKGNKNILSRTEFRTNSSNEN